MSKSETVNYAAVAPDGSFTAYRTSARPYKFCGFGKHRESGKWHWFGFSQTREGALKLTRAPYRYSEFQAVPVTIAEKRPKAKKDTRVCEAPASFYPAPGEPEERKVRRVLYYYRAREKGGWVGWLASHGAEEPAEQHLVKASARGKLYTAMEALPEVGGPKAEAEESYRTWWATERLKYTQGR